MGDENRKLDRRDCIDHRKVMMSMRIYFSNIIVSTIVHFRSRPDAINAPVVSVAAKSLKIIRFVTCYECDDERKKEELIEEI